MKYQAAALSRVSINGPYQSNALQREISYLKALDADRLLAGYFETGGLKPKSERYPGWESSEIQGHTLGHFLTALSQAIESTGDNELKKKLYYILNELTQCQHENGYLSAFREVLFDRVENQEPAWVPWYTMHKIISGLISAYQLEESPVAFRILDQLVDWVACRVKKWSPELQKRVLAVEYGGMNDCLYEASRITGKDEHLKAAHQFDELPLFEALARGEDILNNLHANTTIPKFLGAMKRIMITGDKELYLQACENFWDIVINHHSYITGGNSEWEHFGEPDVLDAERSNCTCETCNTYNMLKLSKGLFEITGKAKYLHYYENTLTNAILPSQNPESGMTMYFQPMATGYFKVYGTPFDKFWCCTGSGMENFTKLNDGIYYTRNDSVLIARYVNSEFRHRHLTIRCTADFVKSPGVLIELEPVNAEKTEVNLKLIKPEWLKEEMKLNSRRGDLSLQDGDDFINIKGSIQEKTQLNLTTPMGLTCHNLPDGQHTYAFKYGPFVLSAALGTEKMEVSKTGVDVTIPTKQIEVEDFLVVENIEYWLEEQKTQKIYPGSKPELQIGDINKTLTFMPHFLQHRERYGIYWRILEKGSPELDAYQHKKMEREAYQKSIIDKIPLGNDQYELEHQVKGEKTLSDTRDGYRHRELLPGGRVSYVIAVDNGSENLLEFKYSLSSLFKFEVSIDEVSLEIIENDDRRFLDYKNKQLNLGQDLINNKKTVQVEFRNIGSEAMRIVDLLVMRRKRQD